MNTMHRYPRKKRKWKKKKRWKRRETNTTLGHLKTKRMGALLPLITSHEIPFFPLTRIIDYPWTIFFNCTYTTKLVPKYRCLLLFFFLNWTIVVLSLVVIIFFLLLTSKYNSCQYSVPAGLNAELQLQRWRLLFNPEVMSLLL